MKPIYFLLLIVPGTVMAQEFPREQIKQGCNAEWPNDYSMQAFCLEEQKEAFHLLENAKPQLDQEISKAFINCKFEWPSDYAMQAFCLEDQLRGRESLAVVHTAVPSDIATQILQKCASEWPLDFSMQSFCAQDQVTGWLAVNN